MRRGQITIKKKEKHQRMKATSSPKWW